MPELPPGARYADIQTPRLGPPMTLGGGLQDTRSLPLLLSDHLAFALSAGLLSALQVATNATHARAAVQAEHLWKRRPTVARDLISRLPEAAENVEYVGTLCGSEPGIRRFVGRSKNRQLVFCALKFLVATAGRSGEDEVWLRTAYYIGQGELHRLLQRRKLKPLLSSPA